MSNKRRFIWMLLASVANGLLLIWGGLLALYVLGQGRPIAGTLIVILVLALSIKLSRVLQRLLKSIEPPPKP